MPRTLVWMPVYNEARHLEKSIRSVLNQSNDDLTLLISDNYSTDLSGKIISRIAAEDSRLAVVRPPSHCKSLDHSTWLASHISKEYLDYDYIWHLGGHDIATPNCLEALQGELAGDSACVASYPQKAFGIDEDDVVRFRYPAQPQTFTSPSFFQSIPLCFSLTYNVPAFSLIRFRDWLQVPIRARCYAVDHLWTTELSTRGTIKAAHAAELFIRITPQSLEIYKSKHLIANKNTLQDVAEQLEWLEEIINICKPSHDEVINAALKAGAWSMYIMRYAAQFSASEIEDLLAIDEFRNLYLGQAALYKSLKERINTITGDTKE